jgi:hypothetical protein
MSNVTKSTAVTRTKRAFSGNCKDHRKLPQIIQKPKPTGHVYRKFVECSSKKTLHTEGKPITASEKSSKKSEYQLPKDFEEENSSSQKENQTVFVLNI